jgi:hypothetical protein
MSDVVYENGAFAFYYDGEFMSSHSTFRVAKAGERRFLKLINLKTPSSV